MMRSFNGHEQRRFEFRIAPIWVQFGVVGHNRVHLRTVCEQHPLALPGLFAKFAKMLASFVECEWVHVHTGASARRLIASRSLDGKCGIMLLFW